MAEGGYWNAITGAGWPVWRLAICEILVVAGISLIPLLGGAVREVLPATPSVSFPEAISKAIFGGQLLFYAVGLVATIVWQSNRDFNSFFPLRLAFNIVSIVILIVATLIIGHDPSPTLSMTNAALLSKVSVVAFVVAAIVYMLMSVVLQVHVNVGKSLASDDQSLSDALRRSRA